MKKLTSLIVLILLIQFTSCSKKDEVLNTAPVIKAQTFETRQNSILTVKVLATDKEEDTLTFSIKKDDSNTFMITNEGTLRVKPNVTLLVKKYLVDIEVSDGSLKSSATITIDVKPKVEV